MNLHITFLALTASAILTAAAPTNPHVLARAPYASTPGKYCGKCVLQGSGQLRELRTSVPANKCNTLPDGETYGPCSNQYCGVCVMFK